MQLSTVTSVLPQSEAAGLILDIQIPSESSSHDDCYCTVCYNYPNMSDGHPTQSTKAVLAVHRYDHNAEVGYGSSIVQDMSS